MKNYNDFNEHKLKKIIKENQKNIEYYSEPLAKLYEEGMHKLNPYYKECEIEIRKSKTILKEICEQTGLNFEELYKAKSEYEKSI